MAYRRLGFDRLDMVEENELILQDIDVDLRILEASYDVDIIEVENLLKRIDKRISNLLIRISNCKEVQAKKVDF